VDHDHVSFGQFRLHLGQRRLSHGERTVVLGSRSLDLLCLLAQARGEVVNKEEILARVWPRRIVEENALHVHVSALRKALDEFDPGQSWVVTVPGIGYRLLGARQAASDDLAVQAPESAPGASIAVLPFQNMSGDIEQEYFADGIVEDIITGLSRIRSLFVIARNSSFVYKGRSIDVKQVGRELGVRYLLEGSVRRAGERVRITAQLIDAANGAHLWAQRYDRILDDIFSVQDDISMSVVGAIEPKLRRIEIERVRRQRPASLDAYDLLLRAAALHDAMPTNAAQIIPLLEQALALDPQYAAAHALLALSHHVRFSRGGLHEEDRAASVAHARAVLHSDSDDATTLATAALVLWFDEHDIPTAFELFDKALSISNSNVVALAYSSFALAWMGHTQLAIDRAQRALKLSPFDTTNSHMALAIVHFQSGRWQQAFEAARHAHDSNPRFSVPCVLLSVALARLGRREEALQMARKALALDPQFTMRRWSRTVGVSPDVFSQFERAWDELLP
jgi:TolB-like protein/Tfp pilus assembly protein PilF